MTTFRPRVWALVALAMVLGSALTAQAAHPFTRHRQMFFRPRLPSVSPFRMRLPEAIPRVPRARIVPIPTRWDARPMLIPTTWQARIMLLKAKP